MDTIRDNVLIMMSRFMGREFIGGGQEGLMDERTKTVLEYCRGRSVMRSLLIAKKTELSVRL